MDRKPSYWTTVDGTYDPTSLLPLFHILGRPRLAGLELAPALLPTFGTPSSRPVTLGSGTTPFPTVPAGRAAKYQTSSKHSAGDGSVEIEPPVRETGY